MSKRLNLSERLIAAAVCPPEQSELLLWDAGQPGLVVRVWPSGKRTYIVRYRPKGAGRRATVRKVTLGEVGALSLAEARAKARTVVGAVAGGSDPAPERKAVRRETERAGQARLSAVLDAYAADLGRRRIVKAGEVLSMLRRELLAPLGDVDLRTLDRQQLVRRINAVHDSGRPGAAGYLRGKLSPFFNYAVNAGVIPANPLAGWRKPRETRAEKVEVVGRSLGDHELPVIWRAAGAADWPFADYLKFLLLAGQRRTETALMRWQDVDLEGGSWTIPAAVTKSGRDQRVPLPPVVVAMLAALPRLAGSDLVFPGRSGRPMSGFSKRMRPVYAATAAAGLAPWTIHDLRRTYRSGLAVLGVAQHVAELNIGHVIGDELARIYDRSDYWKERATAAARWADHVLAMVEGRAGKVVALGRRGRA